MLKFIQNCEKIKSLVESNDTEGLRSVHDELMRAPIEELLNTMLYLKNKYPMECGRLASIDRNIFRRCGCISKYGWKAKGYNYTTEEMTSHLEFFPDEYHNPVSGEIENFSEEQYFNITKNLDTCITIFYDENSKNIKYISNNNIRAVIDSLPKEKLDEHGNFHTQIYIPYGSKYDLQTLYLIAKNSSNIDSLKEDYLKSKIPSDVVDLIINCADGILKI